MAEFTVNGIAKKVRGIRASAERLSREGMYGHTPEEALALNVEEAEFLIGIIRQVSKIVNSAALERMMTGVYDGRTEG